MITDKEAIEAWEKIKELVEYVYYDAPEDLGISQRQFCKMLDYDTSTYNKYRKLRFSFEGVPIKTIEQFVQGYASKIYKMRQNKTQELDGENN